MEGIDRLLTKRAELEQLIQARQEDMNYLYEAGDELSVYDHHEPDSAAIFVERDKNQGLMELWELELEKVEHALERYHKGEYNICERCHKTIEKERIDRLVNTTLCASCARSEALNY